MKDAKKPKKLKLKQQLFCDWYIKTGHITNSAIKAGYSKKTAYAIGSENLKKPQIQAYILKRKTELEDLLGFNKATVIQDLLEIKNKSMQAVPVMEFDREIRQLVQVKESRMDENGEEEEVGVYEYDSQGAIRALENIGKMMDYYTPQKVEDVTPLDKKPGNVIINKTYVNSAPDKSTS
jgi:phage terminase small subunit